MSKAPAQGGGGPPPEALGLIDPALEQDFHLGGEQQMVFDDLVELPSGANATLDGRDHLLLVHEKRGARVASVQYREGHRRFGEITTIFSHRAMSLILGGDGVLRGETHRYKTVIRRGVSGVQRREPDTVDPLTPDDIERFRRFTTIAKEQLSKRPK